MQLFEELSTKRREFVEYALEAYPEIRETGLMNRVQVKTLERNLKESGVKIGHPIWLTGTQEYKNPAWGWYNVPVPGNPELPRLAPQKSLNSSKRSLTSGAKRSKIVVDRQQNALISDEEFTAELSAAGIEL